MKIKRSSQGNTPTGSVQGRVRSGTGTESVKATERKDVADTVTLSEDAMSVGAVNAVNSVETDTDGDRGPLPDPRETGRAILEKELAGVFREIYL